MYEEASAKADKKEKKLKRVFQVLMLHMGLQLFNNSDVAENAINELEAVSARTAQKKNSQNEPGWIEVVMDLFLTLLSQESSVLRNVIRHVFPQLCQQITVTAFHQILSLLDVKSKENPLQANGNDDSDDDDDDEAESDQEDSAIAVDEEEQEEEDEESEASGDDDDEDDDDEEEPENLNDTVRMAVQNALGAAGGDGEEMDVDEIDDAEGVRLDNALAEAFKLLKANRKKKKTKADEMAEKMLLHFRMRALDLVEMYLKNSPQMEICLETLVYFYDLMPVAMRNEKQSPLLVRFNAIFTQLAQLKSFSLETVQNVTQKHLAETLTGILSKTVKEKTNIQQSQHFTRACIFLINCSQILQKLTPGDDEVLKIILQYLQEFYSHRNPILQLHTFKQFLAMQWNGNFKLAKYISDEGLKPTIRSVRRTQSLQMLTVFFKNHNLFKQNVKDAEKYQQKVCERLKTYAGAVDEIPEGELLELIQFVMAMRQRKEFSSKTELVAAIQKFRGHLHLKPNVLSTYKSFCGELKVPFVPNEDVKVPTTKQNGIVNGNHAVAVKNGKADEKEVKPVNGSTKRKKTSNKKELKMKKQQRLEAASKGFSASFSFSADSEVLLD